MRILVVGAAGMMGHMACRVLGERHEVYGTARQPWSDHAPLARFLRQDRWIGGIDGARIESVADAISSVRPDVVLNCVGIVKQLEEAKNAVLSIEINAAFPHRLAGLCRVAGARMVHLSTDCVFSGRRGMYREDDIPDPVDLYGRSKLLGETARGEGLTLRTSIVGRQLTGDTSLFEWALRSRGTRVRGFERAIYSGLTTMALARVIENVVVDHPDLTGVWHVASEPISKYRLLLMLDERLDLGLAVERDETFECDRSLDASAFLSETGIAVPTWEEMLDEFRDDQPTYAGPAGGAGVGS